MACIIEESAAPLNADGSPVLPSPDGRDRRHVPRRGIVGSIDLARSSAIAIAEIARSIAGTSLASERTGHLDRREMAEDRGGHGFSLNTSRFKIAVTLTFGKSTTCAMLRSTATLTST